MDEGNNGDGKKPKPKSEVELLVHNVVRQHTQCIHMVFISASPKLLDRQMRTINNFTFSSLHEVTIGKVRSIGSLLSKGSCERLSTALVGLREILFGSVLPLGHMSGRHH